MNAYSISDAGGTESFFCDENQSLLIAMERSGKNRVAVGCRGGGCGRCKIKVLSGDYSSKKMSAKHISPEDKCQNVVLACRIYPRSNLVFRAFNPDHIENDPE